MCPLQFEDHVQVLEIKKSHTFHLSAGCWTCRLSLMLWIYFAFRVEHLLIKAYQSGAFPCS